MLFLIATPRSSMSCPHVGAGGRLLPAEWHTGSLFRGWRVRASTGVSCRAGRTQVNRHRVCPRALVRRRRCFLASDRRTQLLGSRLPRRGAVAPRVFDSAFLDVRRALRGLGPRDRAQEFVPAFGVTVAPGAESLRVPGLGGTGDLGVGAWRDVVPSAGVHWREEVWDYRVPLVRRPLAGPPHQRPR